MKYDKGIKMILLAAMGLCTACGSTTADKSSKAEVEEEKELVVSTSQVGFGTQDPKSALVRNASLAKSDEFYVLDVKSGDTVYTGKIGKAEYWEGSGEEVSWLDFSELTKEGRYEIGIDGVCSYPFDIKGKDVYKDLSIWSLKTFYLWRCGMDIESKYATFKGIDYAHKGGHPDTSVKVHNSAVSTSLKEGERIESQGGWYDAGDYGKYTTNGAISLTSLLNGYEAFSAYYDTLSLNIPESRNKTADILDECMYELKWLLTMQDTTDGSVAHKLTTLNFAGFVMPDDEGAKAQRYIIGRSTDDALCLAAIMAKASRIFKNNKDYKDFSNNALNASLKAWKWARKNPEVMYLDNPQGVTTGSYSMHEISDRWVWAASELYIATKDEEYLSYIKFDNDITTFNYLHHTPSWRNATGYALTSLAMAITRGETGSKLDTAYVMSVYKQWADKFADDTEKSVGRLSFDTQFVWGSNGVISDIGSFEVIAYKCLGDERYLNVGKRYLNYLTGCNWVNYCFVTGFGTKYPVKLHDRRSGADGIDEPIPGLISGGCNNGQTDDYDRFILSQQDSTLYAKYPSKKYPARCYVDEFYSFSTNEVAINWSAPFATLVAGVSALEK